mgnify:CR=1 FL=1
MRNLCRNKIARQVAREIALCNSAFTIQAQMQLQEMAFTCNGEVLICIHSLPFALSRRFYQEDKVTRLIVMHCWPIQIRWSYLTNMLITPPMVL